MLWSQAKDIKPDEEAKFKAKLGTLDEILGEGDYAAGNSLSIADISIYGTVTHVDVIDYKLDDYPNVMIWRERVRAELIASYDVNEEPIAQLKEWLEEKRAAVIEELA